MAWQLSHLTVKYALPDIKSSCIKDCLQPCLWAHFNHDIKIMMPGRSAGNKAHPGAGILHHS